MDVLDSDHDLPHAAALDVRTVLVPVDAPDAADRALVPAQWLARRLGADVELVVAADQRHWVEEARWLGALAVPGSVTARHVVVGDDPADALTAAIGFGDRVLACMATRARRPLLGSVADRVLERSNGPVVLVGPRSQGPRGVGGPVAVAVDGHPDDEQLVVEAARWSAALGTELLVVTVAEPALASPDGHVRRAHGPEDPERHLASLRAAAAGRPVSTDVEYDPVSVEDGLLPLLDRLAPSLVVVGRRHHPHLRHLVLGDHTTSITRVSPAPVLAVPIGLRR